MGQPRENPGNEGGGRCEKDLSNSHIAKHSRHTRSKIRENVWLVLDLIRFLDWKIKMKKSD